MAKQITISAKQSSCSRNTFIKRMRKENMIYLLYYINSGIGLAKEHLYVASNDKDLLNKMANEADSISIISDFGGCLLEEIKPIKTRLKKQTNGKIKSTS